MSPEIPPEVPSPPRRRWLRRVIAFGVIPLVALVLLAVLAKWVVAPILVRRHISGWLAERSYAHLNIGWASVGFHEVRLHGVSLTDRAGRVYGTADSVVIVLDRPIFGFGRPAIESLRIVHPDVSITLDPDGHFDIQKILKRPPEAPPPSPDPIRLPPTYGIEGGLLHFNTSFLKTTFGTIDASINVLPKRYEWTAVEGMSMGGRASLSGFIGREGDDDWSVQLNVKNAGVAEMTRGTALEAKKLEGRLDGFLSLGRGDGSTRGAIGAGWIDVEEAKILELPVLLSVFNVLRLTLPGDSAVSACRTDFRVLDDRLHFDRFYVLTPGLCLFGDGDVFLDSRVDLNFIPSAIGELPPGIEDVRELIHPATDLFSQNLLIDVEVTGTWTAPDAHPLPVRVVIKPIASFVEWMLGGSKKK
ncbi:MAG: AsmA-like C-terminal region-containing protein [Planctomycetes bacterium]|nr:AsmA-like C-terminal region-containing protein [Planctomycetota bacterium]